MFLFHSQPTPPSIKGLSPKNFTNHSGGARGSDIQWEYIGREYGFNNHKHYYYKNKTPYGNSPIKYEDYIEGKIKAELAAKALYNFKGKFKHNYIAGLLSRNYQQVKNSDGIFAIGKLLHKGDRPYNDQRIAKKDMVGGGTSYAVEMAIQEGKLIYVFDCKTKKWYEYNYNEEKFIIYPLIPLLTPNYAGIGTREIRGGGREAIRKVFENTKNSL